MKGRAWLVTKSLQRWLSDVMTPLSNGVRVKQKLLAKTISVRKIPTKKEKTRIWKWCIPLPSLTSLKSTWSIDATIKENVWTDVCLRRSFKFLNVLLWFVKQRCFLTVWNIKTWSQQAWNTVLLLKKSSICCNLLGLILIVEWKMPLKALRRFTQLKWAKALKCCEISWLFAFSTWTQELLPVREGTIFVRSFWAMAKMYRPLTSRHKLLHLVSARNVSCQEARKVTLFSYSWNILSALKPWTFSLNSLWYRNFVCGPDTFDDDCTYKFSTYKI